MDTPPSNVVARIPRVVRCLDAQGRPVSLSAATLVRSSTALQDLLRRTFATARGRASQERVTVAFQEQEQGELKLEYLVVDIDPPSRWLRHRLRHQKAQAQAALAEATVVVAAAVDAIGPLACATSARWSEAETPAFVDVVLDDARTVRVPRALQTGLGDEAVLELMRQTLRMFVDDDVDRMIIGKDPETPGAYHESVVARSPGLMDFLRGQPLASLVPGGTGRQSG
ncbi:hypothetical protein ACH9EU_05475 [Kocuria sp. M1R5S2]|uniref:hypothetical protein n=1 Tax=Kocuria rhizosphaerae TaxID=3376285 RepID=UPI00378F6DAE